MCSVPHVFLLCNLMLGVEGLSLSFPWNLGTPGAQIHNRFEQTLPQEQDKVLEEMMGW